LTHTVDVQPKHRAVCLTMLLGQVE